MAFAAVAIPYIIAAGAAVSAIGAIQQGRAAKAAANYNAQIASQNAGLARQEAATLEEQQARENYLRLGAIHAAAGKNGGVANEGSVLDVIADVAAQGEFQKQQIRLGGELKARDFNNSSILDNARAHQAERNSYYQAGADLLGGGASAYGSSLLKQGGGPGSYTGNASQRM